MYGVICFEMGLTLRDGNREYFYASLDRLFPGLKERYIREFGNKYVIESPNNAYLMDIFHKTCYKNGIIHDNQKIFEFLNAFEEKNVSEQLSFFDCDFD